MTPKQFKEARQKLSEAAHAVENVYNRYGGMGEYARLRNMIREQEKAHRRFAPAGHKHRLPIESAVDYFVVRCFKKALETIDASEGLEELFSHLANLRSDYLTVLLFVKGHVIPRCKKESKDCPAVFETACELVGTIDHDYTDLT